MAQYIKQGNIFGRIGSGVGKGLAESMPQEMDRARLQRGLEDLGQQKNLTPFQQFGRLSSLPGVTPQMVQSGTDLLRQQAIIDNVRNSGNGAKQDKPPPPPTPPPPSPQGNDVNQKSGIPLSTATTPQSTQAALQPYIPPTGSQIENLARNRMAAEPLIYPNIESARQSIQNEVAADTNKSNAELNKRTLEEDVQKKAEGELQKEIGTLGAELPGKIASRLQQQAVNDVATGKLTPEQAKIKYGEKADAISNDFSNIASWGNMSLITKDPKDVITAISAVQKNAKKGGYQKEAADSMIADNGVTPQFAYAHMYPVSEQKGLSHALNKLPDRRKETEKAVHSGLGFGGEIRDNKDIAKQTLEVAPLLATLMGLEGSPLSIGYELEQKGYDSQVFNQYLLDHINELNLTAHQVQELQKPKPAMYGWMNDWWLKSFSGEK